MCGEAETAGFKVPKIGDSNMNIAKLFLPLFCVSCAMGPTLNPGDSDRYDIYQFLVEYYRNSHHVMGFAEEKFGQGVKKEEGILSINNDWCPNVNGFNKLSLARALESKCDELNGQYMDGWCGDKNTGKPIFYANTWNPKYRSKDVAGCSLSGIRLTAYLFDKELTPAEISTARQLGYLTPVEYMHTKEEKDRQELQRIADSARRKRVGEAYMLSNVGTRICREKDGWNYVGFVEGVNNSKIKISVAEREYPGGEVKDNSFIPITIWDWPSNWMLCE